MTEYIVVLDPVVTAEGFAEGAYGAGWPFVEEIEEDSSTNHELIYRPREEDEENTIHYVEDQFVRVRYALARGPDAKTLGKAIEAQYDYMNQEELLKLAEKDRDDLQTMVDGLMSATVLGGQAGHKRLAKLVEKRLGHENSAVRRAALISVSWLEWPDFRKTVEQMAKEDSEEDVRLDAANLAKSYAARDKGEI